MKEKLIRAAGGLLWRETDGGYQIAIIHRPHYDDWTLPKGKLEKGEGWMEAAKREVEEETGYTVELKGFAGAMGYMVDGEMKAVRFWNMVATGETPEGHDHETDAVLWMSVEEARLKVSYALDRAILDAWQNPEEAASS